MSDNPFEKVLDRLREKGWCKRSLGPEEGPNCINGAIYAAGLWGKGEHRDFLVPIIQDQYPDRTRGIFVVPYFNNHPDTTFEDIERVLEKAAVKWEEERVMR